MVLGAGQSVILLVVSLTKKDGNTNESDRGASREVFQKIGGGRTTRFQYVHIIGPSLFFNEMIFDIITLIEMCHNDAHVTCAKVVFSRDRIFN